MRPIGAHDARSTSSSFTSLDGASSISRGAHLTTVGVIWIVPTA